jgi:hypothetical protein
MPESRGGRVALELAFLAVVAAVLGLARVEPAWVVLTMLVAWLLVALLEWAAWRDEPHWASGRPPRYHVPTPALPQRPPTQELPRFSLYPRPVDAPTWIAPRELRDELLAAAAAVEVEEDDWVGWPDGHLSEPDADPWGVDELPEPEPEPEPAFVPEEVAQAPEPEPEAAPAPEPALTPVAIVAPPRPDVLARHHVDPYAELPERRWPWQRGAEEPAVVELPSLPHHRPDGGLS